MVYRYGDKVRIKKLKILKKMATRIDEKPKELEFGYNSFVNKMFKYCDKEVTITNSNVCGVDGLRRYRILEDKGRYSWHPEWFYPATKAGKILFDNERK